MLKKNKFIQQTIFLFLAIELACGEHGEEKIETMVVATENGRKLDWFENRDELTVPKYPFVRKGYSTEHLSGRGLQETSIANQLAVLLRQGYIKCIRDSVSTIIKLCHRTDYYFIFTDPYPPATVS